MKFFLTTLIAILLFSCTNSSVSNQALQLKIDSLQKKIDHAYRPGFGEFMSSIQIHHNKLWFAGQHQNWKLADFEIGEMKEALEGIKTYCQDRPETKEIQMIDPAFDSISNAIQNKNLIQFNKDYVILTNTCNSCHKTTNHEFNQIKIPDSPTFSNQDFKLK